MKNYHGTFGREPFTRFDLSKVATGSGVKFGIGIYLAESINTGFTYAFKKQSMGLPHYIYLAESPDSTPENTLTLKDPVSQDMVDKAVKELGLVMQDYVTSKQGLKLHVKSTDEFVEFRKLVAMHFGAAGKDWGRKMRLYDNMTNEEKRVGEIKASEWFRSLGYLYYRWPKVWTNPSEWNYAVLDDSVITILEYTLYDDERQAIKTVQVK